MARDTVTGSKGKNRLVPRPGTVAGVKPLKGEPEIPGLRVATKAMIAVTSKIAKEKSKKTAVSMASKKKGK